ncbi:heavy metal translocating P-type ATPase [Rhodovulum sp. BSW8]|uniref:heavy metal translocating P-type ATPase n=1 Tax=Rhodovulum sp. BSW8 TaxID=2259645 RepID=UPI000DE537F3|nr:heavy metal translocating P-type ATPase [Rhodovulum sp. BSW8]RBO53897.1 heavy metal translocating P-type ATPase [Rhodovulum sp. BSW8]
MSFDQSAAADLTLTLSDAGVRIVHEIPGRLRARIAVLGLASLDTNHLAAQFRTIPGVRTVRINADAISVAITHDGTVATRARILSRLSGLRREQLRFRHPDEAAEPSFLPTAGRIALIAGYRLLPRSLARAIVLAAISPRVLRGLRSLLTEGVTVELLDALAVSLGALRGQFRTAVTTDLMMGLGEYLEETTIRHSSSLLLDLLVPNPETAWIESEGGAVEVPFARVRQGDLVVVNAGEMVPVDGIVRGGSALVNQASITGESVPVSREPGDSIIAGSLIESGNVRIEARKVGDETTTAQIAQLIRESLEQRSDTERLAEKHADRQVYMTLGLGAAALLATRDLRRLSSVFLVDYACPIKLSAPVAVRATMSETVARGILIKGGPSIEKLAEADTFVFDKTGTLTRGTLSVTEVQSLAPEDWPQLRLLALAGSLEEHSQHPIARAVVDAANLQGWRHLPHGDVIFDVGYGLRASVEGNDVLIGSRHFLEGVEGVDFDGHSATVERMVAEGKMLLYIAVAGKPVGLIGLRDELRPDAHETVRRLRGAGVRSMVMLSGDRSVRAEAFGRELGFDEIHAELRPEDKLRILRDLQAAGRKVAFIGDGANDAPALAAADVGISMSQGADIARAAADVTLMDDRIGAVADAREACDQAMRIISSNNAAALGINSALFVAASAGLLAPVVAAMMHNGSTVALLVSAIYRSGLNPPAVHRT